jgi:hypothetical protein
MDLYDLGSSVLAECEALLAQPVTGRRLPQRRYVSHGQPPIEECDGVLVVWFSQVEVRQIGLRDAGITNRVVAVNIDVWRCWPTGDTQPPQPTELSAASSIVADDCDRLTAGLSAWLVERCGPVEWRPAVPLGPQGGLAGWRLQVSLALD